MNQPDLFSVTPSFRSETQEFIEYWNERSLWLPRMIGSDRQRKLIREALRRPFFRENWKLGIANVAKSSWLRSKMKPRFSIDFFLDNDKFDKIVEGKYIDDKDEKPQIERHFKDGEEIL